MQLVNISKYWFAFNILWHVEPFLGNDPVNTFPQQRMRKQKSDNFRCYATRCKYTIEEEVLSIWFTYIHCWAKDVFSMVSSRDYISNPDVNQKSVVEREREWSESSAVKEEGFGWRLIVSYCNWLWLRVIVKEAVNKSNHSIQHLLLLASIFISLKVHPNLYCKNIVNTKRRRQCPSGP
jgi:hypothetical protein